MKRKNVYSYYMPFFARSVVRNEFTVNFISARKYLLFSQYANSENAIGVLFNSKWL